MLARKKNPKIEPGGRQVLELPVGQIRPNPGQPRKYFDKDSLWELSESIRQNGVLQPITVRKLGEAYELVAGERRLRAAVLAGLATIPALTVEAGDSTSALLALTENLQRQGLHYLEEATAYQTLLTDYGLTQEELALRLGKRQSTIANKLRLLRLSPALQRILRENDLSERHARALLRIPDEDLREATLRTVVAKNMTVRATEALVERVIQDLRDRPQPLEKREVLAFSDIRLLTNTIRQSLALMEKAGVSTAFQEQEGSDAYTLTIRIAK